MLRSPLPRLSAALVATAAALSLAACGDDPDPDGATRDRADTPSSSSSSSAPSAAFPVTIEHAFGETTVEAEPERVATVAWANHEVPLALGVVPVGMAAASWGDDDGDGVLPWVEERLEEL